MASNMWLPMLLDDEDDNVLETLQIMCLLKKRKSLMHEMISKRDKEGLFNILITKYLFSDEDKFVKFFRITPHIFNNVLENIRQDITSLPCNSNVNPISAEQKLCIVLRYTIFKI